MNRKGNVLLHVLITGVVVALVSAMVLRMTFLRYTATARAHTAAQNLRSDENVLSNAVSAWNGSVCASPPATCGGCSGMGTCSCSCTSCATGTAGVNVRFNVSCSGGAYPACGQCTMTINSGTGYTGNVPF